MTLRQRKDRFLAAARGAGLDVRAAWAAVAEYPTYRANRRLFLEELERRGEFAVGFAQPVFGDRNTASGTASGHYFHQDLYVARKIHAAEPLRHVDVGSRVDGFVSHVAVFRPIEVIDVRPNSEVAGIEFRQADLMDLGEELVGYCDSLSCLHAIEHFGLGRYGDPLDHDGHKKGLHGLHAMLLDEGTLYLSMPIGSRQRVEFDAHRVFSIQYVLEEMIGDRFDVLDFAYVDDSGDMHEEVDVGSPEAARTFDLDFGCGIFSLRKRSS